jgi:hypothetical protein
MPWTYVQKTGELLSPDYKYVATGYAGDGKGRNNPDMQGVVMTGPLPRGLWRMTAVKDSPNTGPFSIVLEPEPGTDALGRSAFRVHGDNRTNDASNGCIILPRKVREKMWSSHDHLIEVVSGLK